MAENRQSRQWGIGQVDSASTTSPHFKNRKSDQAFFLNLRFVRRQLSRAKKQSFIFVLSVALSIITLVALGGFSESVNRSLLRDARQLHAGDIIVRSNFEFSAPLLAAIDALEQQGQVETAQIYEFYSVVRVFEAEDTLLSNLKVVEPGYPFYGAVQLKSGRPLNETLTAGSIVVEQNLLDRLGLAVGDQLRVGAATLTIEDVVLHEPDRPVNFFSLGPRIFVTAADLEAIDLIKKGSRVSYTKILKVNDESQLDDLASQLETVSDDVQERVETYQTAESAVKEFFDDFLFYLSLIGIFTLLLAGIGIQTALTAFLREREQTIAIIKTLGATSHFITRHYLAVVAILGVAGTALGLAIGFALQSFFPIIFRNFLPPNVELVISWWAVVESLVLGFFVVASFTLLPLFRLRDVRPSFIFRKEYARIKRSLPYYLTILAIVLFFAGAVLWQLNNLRIGFYFILGMIGLIMITGLLTQLVLFGLRRKRIKNLVTRQALRGLFRPKNATRSIIITLAASLAVIFSIFLIERNLDTNFVQSYPEDAPNLFFIDIQPDQLDAFAETLGLETDYFPVVRARVDAVNGEPIDRERERERDGDNLARTYSLSYRDYLLEGEKITAGNGLNVDEVEGVQVSILDELLEFRDFKLGDIISFNIQGVMLDAEVTSIRSRNNESFQPFFNFVFTEEALKNAPQTIFTGVRVTQDNIAPLQNRMVAQFPNVNVIDVTAALATFGELIRNLTKIIRFFTLFSIAAGILIIVSSVFATRFARTQEAVYFKVLGAKGRFVLQVFTLENLFLGLASAVLGLLISQVGSWIIVTWFFELDYSPFIFESMAMMGGTVLLVIVVGLLASLSILKQKPIMFLRENSEG